MRKIVIEVPDNCKGCRFVGGNDDNWGKCEIFYGEVLISKDYYKRCPECLAAELQEPKAEVKECVWTFIQVYETKGSVKKIFQTSCHKEVMNNGDNMYCRHCGGKIKEAK